MVAFAVVFVVILFLIKNNFFLGNSELRKARESFANEKVSNLVNKDTDGDGVLDWEENLWGTDPLKADTDDDGVSDAEEIAEIKKNNGLNPEDSANLSKTDEFSRDLFATIATLTQSGEIDQETVDKLSESLALKIAGTPVKKVFTEVDLRITDNNSLEAIKSYDKATTELSKKYQIKTGPVIILAEAILSGELDMDKLSKLDPLVEDGVRMIDELVKITVPSSLAKKHLNLANALQRTIENLDNIRKLEKDVIPALSAITQLENNNEGLEGAIRELNTELTKRLKNS